MVFTSQIDTPYTKRRRGAPLEPPRAAALPELRLARSPEMLPVLSPILSPTSLCTTHSLSPRSASSVRSSSSAPLGFRSYRESMPEIVRDVEGAAGTSYYGSTETMLDGYAVGVSAVEGRPLAGQRLHRHWTAMEIPVVGGGDGTLDGRAPGPGILRQAAENGSSEKQPEPPERVIGSASRGKSFARRLRRRAGRWQFWVFDVLPVLLAVGVSVEVFFLAQQREVAQARDDFHFTATMAHTNLKLTLRKSVESARLLLGALLANSVGGVPSEPVFENMVFSNPFFNMDRTIAKVILVDVVANASRAGWPHPIFVLPDMLAPWGGQPGVPAPDSLSYSPVRYVSPPQPEMVGLDFNADPMNAPFIRLAAGLGGDVVTRMFQLRSGIPGQPEPILFRNGVVYHMPIFRSLTPGAFTSRPTDVMDGVLLFVFWMTGVLELTMRPLQLRHTDVFLFDITYEDFPEYVAHYESPENETRPFYTPENVTLVGPFDLDGDFVTPWSVEYDMAVAQRRYRMVMRGRTGRYATRFSTGLPYILLGLSLAVKGLEKAMHALRRCAGCGPASSAASSAASSSSSFCLPPTPPPVVGLVGAGAG
jgi:hypothetical protein